MTTIDRRTFLKLTGVGAASAAVYEAGLKAHSLEAGPDGTYPVVAGGNEHWAATVCQQCPGGCGLLVRVVDGRAVKVEGNPLHPINKGKVCPKAQAGLQVLYDPDRIKGPMRRVGQRGTNQWESVTWDEAISRVVRQLNDLRANGVPQQLLFLSGRCRGQMFDLIDRFCQAYGTPNHVNHQSIGSEANRIAHYLTQGWREHAAYDWDNVNYLLSFGGSLLEAWRPTTRLLRAYGHIRRGRVNNRARIVQIDPRFSVTAAKADEWVPIRPGTDAALALAMANVIISEDLYDKEFVAEHTHGFDDWLDEGGQVRMGFKTLVLNEYTPRRAAEITGVEASTIARLAREFATSGPAIAAGERGTGMQSNGIFSRMAVHALNALVGSIDVPGGVLRQRQPPFTPWPELVLDDVAENGLAQPRLDRAGTAQYPLARDVYQDLPERILGDDPYPVAAMFLYYTNPLFSSPEADRFRQALDKIPFVVSFSPFLDESTEMADLILPDHTYMERVLDDVIEPSLGYPVVGLRQPVVPPLYNTRNTGDVLLRVAEDMGGTMFQSLPWRTFDALLRFRMEGLQRSEQGSIKATTFSFWWDEFKAKSVWEDPPYRFGEWNRVLTTPSGRFEFYSLTLRDRLMALAEEAAGKRGSTEAEIQAALDDVLRSLKITARGDAVFLPHYEPPRFVGDEGEYPFVLNTYKLMAHAEGRGANSPWLQEMLGPHVNMTWDSWVEINPEVAHELGIADKDWVWLEAPNGQRIKTRAKLYPGARPDVVNVPYELGHTAYGRWAAGRGVNPNHLIANEKDLLGGTTAWFSTRVKVYKA